MMMRREDMSLHLDTIILIPNQPVFALSPQFCVLIGEATNTNLIVFGLTRSELEPTFYRTRRRERRPLHHRCTNKLLTRIYNKYYRDENGQFPHRLYAGLKTCCANQFTGNVLFSVYLSVVKTVNYIIIKNMYENNVSHVLWFVL